MTELKYLEDTYLFEINATVIDVIQHDDNVDIILDQTIFYPQGGGQPADTGIIENKNNFQFSVISVKLDENGEVHHLGNFISQPFNKNDVVKLKINQQNRIKNAKLHSAGHLIDAAILKMGVENKPTKGFHFQEGSYVEYEGVFDNSEDFISKLENTVNDLVKQDLIVEIKELDAQEAQKKEVWAPAGKSARVVNFKGFPICGCGGTHVKSSAEIGTIKIKKIKSKKGKTRVSYLLQ